MKRAVSGQTLKFSYLWTLIRSHLSEATTQRKRVLAEEMFFRCSSLKKNFYLELKRFILYSEFEMVEYNKNTDNT